MALIKCKECGKEISDKAKKCIHCGCPIHSLSNNKTNIFCKIWLIICILLCFSISLINFLSGLLNLNIVFSNNLEIVSGNMCITMGVLALLLGIVYILLLLKTNKKNFIILLATNFLILIYNLFLIGTIAIIYILCVIFNSFLTYLIIRRNIENDKFVIKKNIPILVLFIIGLIIIIILPKFVEYYENDEYIDDNRNSREILVDYIKNSKTFSVATCDEYVCDYSFTPYGIDNTTYYKLDFVNNKFTYTDYSFGSLYEEYDYKNNTGYVKATDNIGWTTTLEVYIIYDEENLTYTTEYSSSGYNTDVSELARSHANSAVELRNMLINMCNDLDIYNIDDLIIN